MREIKFRYYIGGIMRDENFGNDIAVLPNGKLMSYDEGLEKWQSANKIVDVKIMQYTGLKDKNGKEIYESDLIEFEDYDDDINHNQSKHDWFDKGIAKVVWEEITGEVGFHLEVVSPKENKFQHRGLNMKSMKVIGNIYENPNLLKTN